MRAAATTIALLAALAAPRAAAAQDTDTADDRRASEAVAEAGIFGGVRGWKTAYRTSSALFTYGAFGAWIPTWWLSLNASIEHARRTSSPDELKITNTETLVVVGPRFSIWFDFMRIFLDLNGLGVIRTASYRDADVASPARLSLGANIGPGFTIAAAERLGVTVRIAWRRRDDQSHLIGALDVSWLFQ